MRDDARAVASCCCIGGQFLKDSRAARRLFVSYETFLQFSGSRKSPVFELRPRRWGPNIRHVARAPHRSLKRESAFQKKVSFLKPIQGRTARFGFSGEFIGARVLRGHSRLIDLLDAARVMPDRLGTVGGEGFQFAGALPRHGGKLQTLALHKVVVLPFEVVAHVCGGAGVEFSVLHDLASRWCCLAYVGSGGAVLKGRGRGLNLLNTPYRITDVVGVGGGVAAQQERVCLANAPRRPVRAVEGCTSLEEKNERPQASSSPRNR
jgi:hypothetical protein